MANWNTLRTAVADVINTNGNQAITGQLLQNVLNNIITNVGENATFVGIATLDTNPGAPDGPVFYITSTAGTYPNFNGIEVQDGEAVILLWNNNAWSKKTTGFVTQKKLSELGSEVDKLPSPISPDDKSKALVDLIPISTSLSNDEFVLVSCRYYNEGTEVLIKDVTKNILFQYYGAQTSGVETAVVHTFKNNVYNTIIIVINWDCRVKKPWENANNVDVSDNRKFVGLQSARYSGAALIQSMILRREYTISEVSNVDFNGNITKGSVIWSNGVKGAFIKSSFDYNILEFKQEEVYYNNTIITYKYTFDEYSNLTNITIV